MSKQPFVWFSALVLFCLLLSPTAVVLAQDPPPPQPAARAEKPGGSLGMYQQSRLAARWESRDGLSGLAVEGAAPDLSAQAGADTFGYTKKTVPVEWTDISSTGYLLDFSSSPSLGVALPFSFKFFEKTYDTIKVTRYGYLTFSSDPTVNGDSFILRADEPNQVIAPYWAPLALEGGAVYVESFGASPNQSIVFQWNNVSDQKTGGANRFTFQAVLYENGSIRFQYTGMSYTWGYSPASAGLEDATGVNGLVSLKYRGKQKSNTALLFTRPTAGVSLSLFPLDYGQFTGIGQAAAYRLRVKNTGEAGQDVYKVKISSRWPAVALQSDGVTPLADSDGDRQPDTGPVPAGSAVEVVIQVTSPATAKIGQSLLSSVTITSSLKTSRRVTARLITTIPSPFTQVYAQKSGDNFVDGNAANLTPIEGFQSFSVQPGTDGYSPAGVRMANGNGFYTWSHYGCAEDACEGIFYNILNLMGNELYTVNYLPMPASGTWEFAPAPAPAPNGNVGMVYMHTEQTGGGTIDNVYFVLLDSGGSRIAGPTNLTKNTSSIVKFFNPKITSTPDSWFLVSFDRFNGGNLNDIYLTELNPAGKQMSVPAAYTADPGDGGGYYGASVILLKEGNILLAYNGWKARGSTWTEYAYYTVLAPGSDRLRPETGLALGSGVVSSGMDTVQLSGGQVLLGWSVSKNGVDSVYYAVLKVGTYAKVKGPVPLSIKPALTGSARISVTADREGRGILTWADGSPAFGRHLYYALVGSSGALVTKPVIFMTSAENEHLYLGAEGYGNLPFDPPSGP